MQTGEHWENWISEKVIPEIPVTYDQFPLRSSMA